MRKIIAALLLTCMLTFTAMAGEMHTPGSAATDGVIECPSTGHIQTTSADGSIECGFDEGPMDTPFADGQMEFPLVLLMMLLL